MRPAIRMMNAVLVRLTQCHSHVQRPDRQIPLHPVTDRPADDAPGVQIEDNGQIQPTFARPDVADVSGPFLVGAVRREILIQQVGSNVERVIAVCRRLILLGSDNLDTILTHQTAHAPVPNPQPQFLQLLGHPWSPIALQAKTVLLTDMGQKYHIIPLAPLMHVYMHCRVMDGSWDVSAKPGTHVM